jgi:hypothetical protein
MSETERSFTAGPSDELSPERRARPGPPLVRLLAVAFLFLPLTLYVVGVRPADVDNAAPARLPTLSMGWGAFNQLDAYATDRLPLRDVAIRTNARLSESVFGQPASLDQSTASAASGALPGTGSPAGSGSGAETPVPAQTRQKNFLRLPPPAPETQVASNGEVTVGTDGWLYYTGEFYKECVPGQPPAQVAHDLERLNRILTASGRRFIFTLAPDKSTAEPQHLPSVIPYASCVKAAKKQTFQLLKETHIAGYVDMRDLIAQRQAAEHRVYYMRKDTHWNQLADALFAEQVARLINPNLLTGLVSKESIANYTGDLTVLLGDPEVDQTIDDALSRPGVHVKVHHVSLTAGFTRLESVATTVGPPLVTGRTLLVGDSFSEAVEPQLRPFFAKLLAVENRDFALVPETMFDAIKGSTTIILVWNERYFTDPNYSVMWSPEFLDKLQSSLGHLEGH